MAVGGRGGSEDGNVRTDVPLLAQRSAADCRAGPCALFAVCFWVELIDKTGGLLKVRGSWMLCKIDYFSSRDKSSLSSSS